MPEDKRRIITYVALGMTKHEDSEPLPDGWDEMSEEDRQEYLDDAAETTLQNHIDFGAYVDGERLAAVDRIMGGSR